MVSGGVEGGTEDTPPLRGKGSLVSPSSAAVASVPTAADVLGGYSLDSLIEIKVARFLDQLGDYPPRNLHAVMMEKFEKPLLVQVMRRSGGNQVHAARTLGINRNTLRKRLKAYGITSPLF